MKNPFSRKNKINKDDISSLQFRIGGFFYGFDVLEFTINDKAITVTLKHGGRELTGSDYRLPMEKNISVEEWKKLLDALINKVCINKWKESYSDNTILDGTQWSIEITKHNGHVVRKKGINAYPTKWNEFRKIIIPYFEEAGLKLYFGPFVKIDSESLKVRKMKEIYNFRNRKNRRHDRF